MHYVCKALTLWGGGIFKSDDASDIEFPEPEDGDAPDRRTTSGNQTGPIGTATLLLLGLGGAAVGYKVAKNSKNQKEEDK